MRCLGPAGRCQVLVNYRALLPNVEGGTPYIGTAKSAPYRKRLQRRLQKRIVSSCYFAALLPGLRGEDFFVADFFLATAFFFFGAGSF